ncbi:hypothetical protein BJ165DRAFT_1532203 [Panaeolus papilionaceus]|nr:hypothetical protein BJ165DRAFT_1532203 [Panaeolus papilionaceus]
MHRTKGLPAKSLGDSTFRMPTRLRTRLKARHGAEDLVKRALDHRQTTLQRIPPAPLPKMRQQESLTIINVCSCTDAQPPLRKQAVKLGKRPSMRPYVEIRQKISKKGADPMTNSQNPTTLPSTNILKDDHGGDQAQQIQPLNSDEDEGGESGITDILSLDQKHILFEGFTRVQELIRELSVTSGVNVEVIERLRLVRLKLEGASLPRSGNDWNTYASLFAQSPDTELARLEPGQRPEPGQQISPNIISLAYNRFKIDHGDKYREVLRVFRDIQMLKHVNVTEKDQSKMFKQYFSGRICRIMDVAATFGFHSSLEACTSTPSLDPDLSLSYQTSFAKDFYKEMLQTEPLVVQRVFRAHVQRQAAQTVIQSLRSNHHPDTGNQHVNHTNTEGAEKRVVQHLSVVDTKKVTEKEQKEVIHSYISGLLESVKITSTSKQTWTLLPELLATNRVSIVNWPHGAAFPTTYHNNKGLANLGKGLRLLYLSTIEDNPDTRLRIVSWCPWGKAEDTPIIQCAPVPAQGRAKCLYANEAELYNGPTSEEKGMQPAHVQMPMMGNPEDPPPASRKKKSKPKRTRSADRRGIDMARGHKHIVTLSGAKESRQGLPQNDFGNANLEELSRHQAQREEERGTGAKTMNARGSGSAGPNEYRARERVSGSKSTNNEVSMPLNQIPSRAHFTGSDTIFRSQLRAASTSSSASRNHSPYVVPDMHHPTDWVEGRNRHNRPLQSGLPPSHLIGSVSDGRYNGSLRMGRQYRDAAPDWRQSHYYAAPSFARFEHPDHPTSN